MTAAELRAALKRLGLTQLALAGLLGIHKSTVNAWAMGTVDVPRYAVAYLELSETRVSEKSP